MKIVFRISTRLRSYAPVPRNFLPIAGLDHLGHVFDQRIYTKAEDFNAVLVQINDPRFPNRGCAFFPYALTAEDEAKMIAEAPVAAIEAAAPVARPEHPTIVADLPVPTFTLDDKAIMSGGVRVAGLFGEDKQLRVLSAHSDLRPTIEAWLQSQLQPV